jgi:hypothetical protein
MRQEIEEMLSGWEEAGHPLDGFIRLGARYMLQVALEQEAEITWQGSLSSRFPQKGWRNGYKPGKAKTADAILEIDLPQLRATEEPYHSRLARMFREGSDILGRW